MERDLLLVRLEDVDREIQETEAEKSKCDQAIGSEVTALELMDGSGRASELAQRAEGLMAELQGLAEQYFTIRAAEAVLQKEIEAFRERNQTPLLRQAGEIFRHLTLSSFSRLLAHFDESDRQVLRGIRESGQQVPVEGMSDGTRDQLFLALRIAGLEGYMARSEPLPLIVDDILINYDDARGAATLETLAALSDKTQIIFFTHHEHLVGVAKEVVPPERLFVQEL